jgi:lincosamide nucleotidyltransferase A/C/D/E
MSGTSRSQYGWKEDYQRETRRILDNVLAALRLDVKLPGLVAEMTVEDVIDVLAALDAGGIAYWVDGGWGLDALHGQQTRTHRDLDLGVRLDDVPRIETLLPQFRRESEEEWPGFLRLQDERGRVVDLLLVERSEAGELWQQLAGGRRVRHKESETRASGYVGGRAVQCASVALQLEHHNHPEATDQDRADIEALRRKRRCGRPS